MSGQKFFEKDYQEMVRLYKEGYTTNEIAEASGASAGYVSSVVRRRGTKMRGSHRRRFFSPIEEKEICRMYRSGDTIKEIVEVMGSSCGTVHHVLIRNNVERRQAWPRVID